MQPSRPDITTITTAVFTDDSTIPLAVMESISYRTVINNIMNSLGYLH